MRLSKIKIAGFKSFVDPTTIDLRSNLTGVVGPNGCGKSNVIDAVRWVMGESSAKHLRGATMDDVIFNGSSSRKSIGQAHIELIFDNADNALGGEYSEFSEIGIKRQISRDGQSKYFLNGTRCRRRDITDIFLGTGLGPRSYAIIEQGMISRLIDAKPEELRNTLEEAAGISKYKDRRRETERRIKHTRENLDRLADIRDELEKQISHLDRQAKAAEKYKTFKQQERLTQAELILLRLQKVQLDIKARQDKINESATTHQAKLAEQRSIENNIETARSKQHLANDGLNTIQGRFYEVGAEISRLEQTIQHNKELQERQQQDLLQIETEINSATQHAEEDRKQLELCTQQLDQQQPQLEAQQKQLDSSTASLSDAEMELSNWQQSWNLLQQKLAEPTQQAQVERARMEQLENQLQQIAHRLVKLQAEQGLFSTSSHQQELKEQQQALTDINVQFDTAKQQYDDCKRTLQTQDDEIRELQQKLQKSQSDLQSLTGKLSSLEVLQKASLGQDDKQRAQTKDNWLADHKLENSQLLAESISIETGWEKALEVVAGDLFESLQIDSTEKLQQLMEDVPEVTASFIIDSDFSDTVPAYSLASKVVKPKSLHPILSNIYCVESLEEGIKQQANLKSGECLVTREGLLLGSNWLKKTATDKRSSKEGVLSRQKEIKKTQDTIETLEKELIENEVIVEKGRNNKKQLDDDLTGFQEQLNKLHRNQSQTESFIHTTENRIIQTETNQQRVIEEIVELELQQQSGQDTHKNATKLRNSALSLLDDLEIGKKDIEGNDAPLLETVTKLRSETQNLRDQTQDIKLTVKSLKTTQTSAKKQLGRFEDRQAQLMERKTKLLDQNSEVDSKSETKLAEQLEQKLEQRKSVETELSSAREALQSIDNDVRELELKRHSLEKEVEDYRSSLESLKMEWQEVSVREQTLQEQFDETGFETESLIANLDEQSTLQTQQNKLDGLQNKISRLGAINLAAIDEFKTQSERKVYLEQQNEDLLEALETLETAIAKIDKDTKNLFKDTFEKVNTRIQEMFPQLFGGGKAHLEMTGDDLLTTGIAIMAQPPGKRISSIHLMSGGEKALTAVAMVFAIFELNPAPFCMLDEVDAPLDEANVGRFCQLVRKMSDRVQFIFITHNKTTMEMAENLVGVTMREPGVSRLVSVDVNEAARMAKE